MFCKKKRKKNAEAEDSPKLGLRARRRLRKAEKKAEKKTAKINKKAEKKLAALNAKAEKKTAKKEAKATAKAAAQPIPNLDELTESLADGLGKISPVAAAVVRKGAKNPIGKKVISKVGARGGKAIPLVATMAPTLIPVVVSAYGVAKTAWNTRSSAQKA